MKRVIVGLLAAVCAGPAMAQVPVGPDKEAMLIEIVDRFGGLYRQAPNDMAKGAVRHDRSVAICKADIGIIKAHGLVKDWTGVIEELDSVGDGRGILYVRISPDVLLQTTNNTFSEQFGKGPTLIPVDSPLFRTVVQMKVGQKVRFSGTFFGGDTDCLNETSLTSAGSMAEPAFLFRFHSVEAVR